jgi:type IV fimbrial biogenesis protein FimT
MIWRAEVDCCRHSRRNSVGVLGGRGFTLIELMIVLAVAAVLLALAVPSMSQFTLSGKLRGYSNEIVASVILARSEAIKRNQAVRMCAANAAGDDCASGDWEGGWIVITADDEVLHRQQPITDGFKIISAVDELFFQPSGVGATTASFTVCRATPSVGSQEREVSVSAAGRARVVKPEVAGSCT